MLKSHPLMIANRYIANELGRSHFDRANFGQSFRYLSKQKLISTECVLIWKKWWKNKLIDWTALLARAESAQTRIFCFRAKKIWQKYCHLLLYSSKHRLFCFWLKIVCKSKQKIWFDFENSKSFDFYWKLFLRLMSEIHSINDYFM